MHNDDADGMIAGINITPLVDVSLVLLVVMMIAAPLIARRAIPMTLPSARTAEPTADGPLVVELFGDGAMRVNHDAVRSLDELRVLAGATDPTERAIIRADASVRHGRVISTIDALKRAGITRIAFAAVQSEGALEPN